MHGYFGKYRRVGPGPQAEDMSLDELEAGKTNLRAEIRRLYNAGVPLFTRDAIQDLSEQLENIIPRKKIYARGVSGVVFEFDVQIGRIKKPDQSDVEYILYVCPSPWSSARDG